jgi:hypothetical protein
MRMMATGIWIMDTWAAAARFSKVIEKKYFII